MTMEILTMLASGIVIGYAAALVFMAVIDLLGKWWRP